MINEKGIGEMKREKILNLLPDSKLLQKEIAEQTGVSEATVSRIKKEYGRMKSEEIISDIIKVENNYPVSELSKKSLGTEREQGWNNYELIKKFQTAQNRHNELNSKLQLSPLVYYKMYKRNIRLVQILRNKTITLRNQEIKNRTKY